MYTIEIDKDDAFDFIAILQAGMKGKKIPKGLKQEIEMWIAETEEDIGDSY